ncbi:hypothetical protein ACD591_15530 [Rufibacter glacialis]|uniref:Uncharacterized protein n=1 Tax=Rufibacter glacialis TaxID=1259555 RepID=A0A5M8QN42_9BACT|nr:hypothetical protein [Rufibacter glacialis]KAA6437637.1 hypothetical protein FOE74_03810 [Rufibacter glacialis]GGK57652.1 hypothetical protein GCM10011405_02140 [Rufibacter glacialis]
MPKPLLLLLVLCYALSAQAQKDTLRIKNLSYSSSFEEKHFKALEKGEQNKLALLLTVNPTVTEKELEWAGQSMQQLYTALEASKIREKTLPKQVKLIFDMAHRQFLKKYEEIASFDQIMKTGTYNCVSATALYALVLEHYGIGYEIKQLPTHVYLVADPKGSKIMMESTNPLGGYFAPDPKFKKSYVEYLQKGKLVSEEEVRTKGVEAIFNENFKADKAINFQQLVSLQYYNEGIKQYEEQAYDKAGKAFQKAYHLHPSHETRYLLTSALALQMEGLNYDKMEQVELLTSFYAMQPGDAHRDEFTNDFKVMTQKHLLDKPDTVFYNKIFAAFKSAARDSVSYKDIAYVYHFHNGRVKALNNQHDQALEYLTKAYGYNQASAELRGVLKSVFYEQLNRNRFPGDLSKTLENYQKTFSFLQEDPHFHSNSMLAYARAIQNAFNDDSRTEGRKLLLSLETLYKKDKGDFTERMMGELFVGACQSYYRAKNATSMKEIAKKGLTYDPKNERLQMVAKMPANARF